MFLALAERWQQEPPARWILSTGVVAMLASDVFLPVPSGPISTLAGSHLGILLGTAVSTLGMTLGAAIAFALAKTWGQPLVERYASAQQFQHLETSCAEHGVWMLLITRPLPIFAEACALWVGGLQMPWRQFLPTVLVSNTLIAATYSALGQHAAGAGWLPAALCASVALPLLVTWGWRRKCSDATRAEPR
jgi:3-dehydroquinate synthase